MYLDHRTVDHKANIIVDAYVTEGNVHDSTPYVDRMEYLEKIEYQKKEKNYITLEKKKQNKVLQTQNKITDIGMPCIEV